MGRTTKLRVLTYDISDDRRRRRVASLLEDEATRVQFSVFEGRFSDAEISRLVDKIEYEIESGDSLRVYSIGSTSERSCRVLGTGIPIERATGYWLL